VRVRAIRLVEESGPVRHDATPWLTLGNEYVVLAIQMSVGLSPQLRLVTDRGDEGAFDASLFVVIDDRPSSRWRAAIDADGSVEFGPATWLTADFWAHFYDDTPGPRGVGDADETYKNLVDTEVAAMIEEDRRARP
jgi:hypothetical protein